MDTGNIDDAACAALALARKDVGLSQRTLAVRLQKAHSFVAKIEVGERRVTVGDFVMIARAIGADPRLLFDRILG